MTDTPKDNPNVYDKARHAVEALLKLESFVNDQWDKIETRLLDAESRADEAEALPAKPVVDAAETVRNRGAEPVRIVVAVREHAAVHGGSEEEVRAIEHRVER